MNDAVLEQLRDLSRRVGPDVVASPSLAATVLRRRRTKPFLIAGVAIAAAAVGAVGARSLGSSPYFSMLEPSASMRPTIDIGDTVVLDRGLVPRGGDVVSATVSLDGRRFDVLKRVVAVGGQTIACPGATTCDSLVVDGVALDEPYATKTPMPSFGPILVPEHAVFLVGDDRADSRDSRNAFGPVQLDAVRGVALEVRHPDGSHEPISGAPRHPAPGDDVDPPSDAPPAGASRS